MFDCVHTWPLGEVWHCGLGDVSLACPDILSSTERARAQRFYREADRQRFVASHVALRRLLADKLHHDPAALVFANGPHGKPFLPDAPHCHFNLSHSGAAALMVISMHTEVGVDIEHVRELRDAEGLVARHFTPAEQLDWHRQPLTERPMAFHQMWARKEACVKAVGWGLRLPLETIDVGSVSAVATPQLQLPDGNQVVVSVSSLLLGGSWAAALAWLNLETSCS